MVLNEYAPGSTFSGRMGRTVGESAAGLRRRVGEGAQRASCFLFFLKATTRRIEWPARRAKRRRGRFRCRSWEKFTLSA